MFTAVLQNTNCTYVEKTSHLKSRFEIQSFVGGLNLKTPLVGDFASDTYQSSLRGLF